MAARTVRVRARAVRRLAAVTATLAMTGAGLVLVASAADAATPTCFGLPATIVGNSKNNVIRGTSHRDVIVAGAGDDIVYGNGGDDVICGGDGADRLYGGAGNDVLAGERGRYSGGTVVNDFLSGDSGNDVLSPGFDGRGPSVTPDQISFGSSKGPVTIDATTHTATGDGNDRWLGDRAEIIGSPYADTFNGGPLSDLFTGAGGADKIYGNGGDDVLRDDFGSAKHHDADLLDGGPGNDQLISHGGFDTLLGGDGNDILNDYTYDASSMQGGPGDDIINDGISTSSAQVEDGGPGNDKYNLYLPVTKSRPLFPRLTVNLAEQTGSFQGYGTFKIAGIEALFVHNAPVTFTGDDANNYIWSDGVSNLFAWGGPGNDTFVGTYGTDSYDGGPGTDRVLSTGGGTDRCTAIEIVSNGGSCPNG